jgi:hypothetical protein
MARKSWQDSCNFKFEKEITFGIKWLFTQFAEFPSANSNHNYNNEDSTFEIIF